MRENTQTIIINRPIGEVFEFSTNPKNTGKWFDGIAEERASEWPPKIGTIYENRGDLNSDNWNRYRVSDFEANKTFELTNGNFSVRYTYRVLDNGATEMTYREWVAAEGGGIARGNHDRSVHQIKGFVGGAVI